MTTQSRQANFETIGDQLVVHGFDTIFSGLNIYISGIGAYTSAKISTGGWASGEIATVIHTSDLGAYRNKFFYIYNSGNAPLSTCTIQSSPNALYWTDIDTTTLATIPSGTLSGIGFSDNTQRYWRIRAGHSTGGQTTGTDIWVTANVYYSGEDIRYLVGAFWAVVYPS